MAISNNLAMNKQRMAIDSAIDTGKNQTTPPMRFMISDIDENLRDGTSKHRLSNAHRPTAWPGTNELTLALENVHVFM